MKNNYLIVLAAISIVGFVLGIYLKYYKTYQIDIWISLKTDDNESQQSQLNLGENIEFLEELDKAYATNGVERSHLDRSTEALHRLKTINVISIALILVSGFLFLWSVQKLNKIRAVSLYCCIKKT